MSPPRSLVAVLLCRPDLSCSGLPVFVIGGASLVGAAGVLVRRLPIPRVTVCRRRRRRPAGRSPTRTRSAVDHRLTTEGHYPADAAPRRLLLLRQSTTYDATTTTYDATATATTVTRRTGTRRTAITITTTTRATTTTTTLGICAGAPRPPRGEVWGLLRVNRHGAPSPRVRCIGRPGYGSSSFSVTPHRRPRAMCPPAGIAT